MTLLHIRARQLPELHIWSKLQCSIFVQITGGHPFKSPRQDVNAPDLYIPVVSLFTYCILGSISMVVKGQWTTDSMYALVSLLHNASCTPHLFGFICIPDLCRALDSSISYSMCKSCELVHIQVFTKPLCDEHVHACRRPAD